MIDELQMAEMLDDEDEQWKKFMIFLKGRNADTKLKMARPKFSPRVKTLGKITAAQLAETVGTNDPVVVIT